jgi:uncharacterized protein YwbE
MLCLISCIVVYILHLYNIHPKKIKNKIKDGKEVERKRE